MLIVEECMCTVGIGAMALRNLTSKVGIPALRRASGPPVSPPAGTTRPLTSGSYQVRVRSSRVFRPASTDTTCRRIESWTRAVNYMLVQSLLIYPL